MSLLATGQRFVSLTVIIDFVKLSYDKGLSVIIDFKETSDMKQ